jgi:magnesium transporter
MAAFDALTLAYAEAHPHEIGRLLDRAESHESAEFLAHMPAARAAFVLDAMMPLSAAETLSELAADAAAAIVAELDPRSAAALLGRVDAGISKRVLEAMPVAQRTRLQTLLGYDPACAGSRIDPRAVAVADSTTVADVFEQLRRAPDGILYYVYALDEIQRLVGVFSLRELMSAAPDAEVATIMIRNPQRIRAFDSVESIVRHPAWRRVHALPVVDATERFLGVLRYSVLRNVEAELGQSSAGPDPSRTASALAELYALGAGGFSHLLSGLLAGTGSGQGGR